MCKITRYWLCALAVLLLAVPAFAAPRLWTDLSGKFQVKAEFVKMADGEVWLRMVDDNRVIKVALEKLSVIDQQMATQLAQAPTQPAAASTAEPATQSSDEALPGTIELSRDWEIRVPTVKSLMTYAESAGPYVAIGKTVYDLGSGGSVGKISRPKGLVSTVNHALSQDGRFYAEVNLGEKTVLRICETGTGAVVRELEQEPQFVSRGLAFVTANKVAWAGSLRSSGIMLLVPCDESESLQEVELSGFPLATAVAPHAPMVAVAFEGRIDRVDARRGKVVSTLRKPGFVPRLLKYSPDGSELAALEVSNREKRFLVYSRTGQVRFQHTLPPTILIHGSEPDPVEWLPDRQGWLLASRYLLDRGTRQLAWQLNGGTINRPVKIVGNARLLAVSGPEGAQVLKSYPIPREEIASAIAVFSRRPTPGGARRVSRSRLSCRSSMARPTRGASCCCRRCGHVCSRIAYRCLAMRHW